MIDRVYSNWLGRCYMLRRLFSPLWLW